VLLEELELVVLEPPVEPEELVVVPVVVVPVVPELLELPLLPEHAASASALTRKAIRFMEFLQPKWSRCGRDFRPNGALCVASRGLANGVGVSSRARCDLLWG